MDITIINEKDEPLLKRKKVVVEMFEAGATPSRAVLKDEVAKKLKADVALLDIATIEHHFGGGKVKVVCYVYKDAKLAEKLTKDGLKKRKEARKKKPAAAAS
ncbi:MAG: hypothetical protein KJ955_06155 [Nanoarchaeota archaeon]|nr:hypothetical protein [Nanoarchaeota archaeon]